MNLKDLYQKMEYGSAPESSEQAEQWLEEHQRQFQNARLEAAELMRQQQQIQQTIAGIEAEVETELLQITTDISNDSERDTK